MEERVGKKSFQYFKLLKKRALCVDVVFIKITTSALGQHFVHNCIIGTDISEVRVTKTSTGTGPEL